MSATFLEAAEICELTGRRSKSKQIEALRTMGLPFWVNPIGKPVVARVAIEGGRKEEKAEKAWVMPRIQKAKKAAGL